MSDLRQLSVGQLSNLVIEDRCESLLLYDKGGFESSLQILTKIGIANGMDSQRLAWAVAFNINGVPLPEENQNATQRRAGGYRDRWAPDTPWSVVWPRLLRPLAPGVCGYPCTFLSELALSVACEQREDWQSPSSRPTNLEAANRAFDFVYEINNSKVLGMARKLCWHYEGLGFDPEAIAKDAWARVFLEYWSARAPRRFNGFSSISTMVRTVVRNITMDSIRSQHRSAVSVEELRERESPASEFLAASNTHIKVINPTAKMESDQLYRRAMECLEKLPPRRTVVAQMVWLRQINARRVAQILGITEQAVSLHLREARVVVGPCLQRYGFDLSG